MQSLATFQGESIFASVWFVVRKVPFLLLSTRQEIHFSVFYRYKDKKVLILACMVSIILIKLFIQPVKFLAPCCFRTANVAKLAMSESETLNKRHF